MAISTKRNTTKSLSKNNEKIKKLSLVLGIALILMGAIFFLLSLKEVITSEVKYAISDVKDEEIGVQLNSEDKTERKDKVTFLSPNFGIAIPKIDANANVIKNVNPFSENEYNSALALGVAHANGTALPGQKGNIFMFAHSAVNFYESGKYNVYFYLLPKLKKDDKIYVSYQNKIYTYAVEEVKTVSKTDVKYLGNYKDYNTLTLMTCWPAGMDISRVIVTAREISN